jgi:hypothetical protein
MENKRGESMNKLIGQVIKELGHVFDVLSSAIKNNRERIIDLEKRIKEIEDTFIIKEDKQ